MAEAGITAAETRPPSGLTGGSCAYALWVSEKQTRKALARIGEIPHGGTYCREGNGYRQI